MEPFRLFCRNRGLVLIPALAALLLAGCSKQGRNPGALAPGSAAGKEASSSAPPAVVTQDGQTPPSGLVTVSFGPGGLTLWPYTSASLAEVPSDPVNLLFAGKADPVRIRSALLGLNGDRTAFGFPPVYPYNATWSDAVGDVQANFSTAEGWQASVIQLQLGTYSPIRAHLRLFRTGAPFGDGGTWTVGAAHFEVLIPGTADHEVLSWELARQLVVVDLIRSGILDPSTPYQPSDVLTQAPTFRTIREAVYNQLPEELKAAIGGPPGSVSAPVPIVNDGRATILHVTGDPAPVQGSAQDQFTLVYEQVIPKPLCLDSPLDYVLIQGPVELSRSTLVDATGRYQYQERVQGQLTVTPLDVTTTPPTPAGTPYRAEVGDLQSGVLSSQAAWALGEARRIAPQRGGTEFLMTRLRVASDGPDAYRAQLQCQ